MDKYGLLVSYDHCDGCRDCERACQSGGLAARETEPMRLGSGRLHSETVAIPTDLCDRCGSRGEPACVQACTKGCLELGKIRELAPRMTRREMALFTLK